MITNGSPAQLCSSHAQYSAWEDLPVATVNEHVAAIACCAKRRVELRRLHDSTFGTVPPQSEFTAAMTISKRRLPSFSPWQSLRVVKLVRPYDARTEKPPTPSYCLFLLCKAVLLEACLSARSDQAHYGTCLFTRRGGSEGLPPDIAPEDL